MRSSNLAGIPGLVPQLVFALGLLHAPALLAANCVSAQTGNWNVNATWQAACGGIPTNGDTATVQNGHTVTVTGADARADALTVAIGGTLVVTNRQLRIDTTTDIAGTLTFNNAGGDGRFDGLVTITGTWSNTGNADINFRNGLTVNGTAFTAGTGAYTFTTNDQTIGGTLVPISIPNVTVTGFGVVLTNSGTLTVSTSLAGTGSFTNGATGVLNFGGATIGVNNFTANAAGNIVNYNGAAQTVRNPTGATYHTLILSGSAVKTMPGANLAINGDFTMSGTASATPGGALNVGGDFTLGSGTTFNASTFSHSVAGDFTNNGATFNRNTSTFTFDGAAAQAIDGTVTTVFNNLTVTNASAAVSVDANVNVNGTLNMNGANTLLSPDAAVIVGGTGTLTGTGTVQVTKIAAPPDFSSQYTIANKTLTNLTVEYAGGAAQTVNALTYGGLKINNASGVTLAGNTTVNTLLTFTNGKVTTGASSIIVGTAGTIATPSAASYVVGNFQKNYNAGANLGYVAGVGFPVGDAGNYTPVDITAGTTTTAGNLTVSTFTPDHPQVSAPIASTGIDAARSVNRYWRFANSGLTVGTPLSATFTFVAGDIDAGPPAAAAANFIVERYDGTNWNPTALVAANPLSTQVSNITPLAAGANDFAIGEALAGVTAVPGRYNVFETSTPAGSVLGKIQTKVTGTGFSLDVVHLNAGKTGVQGGAINVEVRLLDSSGGGALDVNGCNAAWPLIQAAPTFTIPASGRGTLPAITVNNSYRSVRFQIRSPVGGPYTQIGCSTDLFAIRPQSITISAHDATWQTAGTGRALSNVGQSGGVVHAASTGAAAAPRPFTLRATPVPNTATNYNGNPTTATGFPACGTLCSTVGALSFTAGSWTSPGSGVRENATAHYSEAGTFNLGLEDGGYASVDVVDGSSSAIRAVPSTATVEIGRFVPDRFVFVLPGTPALQTFGSACTSRSFTYIGQPFWYATLPSATIQAVNANGAVTRNYSGTLFKLIGADFTETYSNNGVGTALSCKLSSNPATTCTPANAPPSVTAGTGLATGTGAYAAASSGSTLIYARDPAVLVAPFTAKISLSVTATDGHEAVGVLGNPGNGSTPPLTTAATLVFDGIASAGVAFDAGAEFRYGRVRILNGSGPTTVDVPVPLRAEYYVSAAAGFAINTADNCTSFVPKNFVLSGHQPSLTTTNMVSPTAVTDGNVSSSGAFALGGSTVTPLRLLKPTPAVTTPGAVKICLDLDSAAGVGDTDCQAATPANRPFLQGPWSGSGSHDKDPSGQVNLGTFGLPRNFIFQRENF